MNIEKIKKIFSKKTVKDEIHQNIVSGLHSGKNEDPGQSHLIQNNNHWLIVQTSQPGKLHLEHNIPCQDSNYVEYLKNNWGFAIISDGAGSAPNSQIGSQHVAKEIAPNLINKIFEEKKWDVRNAVPTESEWKNVALTFFKTVRMDLQQFADVNNYDLKSLACTCILVIFSPNALLVTHIGDGRAGVLTDGGIWKSIIVPHNGEEANQTIFVTSDAWQNDKDLTLSSVPVPESRVITEKILAITLMSDGCEMHSFECSKMDLDSKKWTDPNLPYPKFFNPLISQIKDLRISQKLSVEQVNEKWDLFIKEGTSGLQNETDDKSMILVVYV